MSYLNILKSGSRTKLKDYIKHSPSLSENWGDDNTVFISTDTAVQYLLYLLEEKSSHEHQYAMTQTITTDPHNPETSIDIQAKLLATTYSDILSKAPNITGIYTVLNVSDGKTLTAHQNWICLDVKTKTLIRFEPSRDYIEFQTGKFCELVVANLLNDGYKFEYRIADKGLVINSFMGCRAMSTMLASMYVMGIPLDKTSLLRLKKGDKKGNKKGNVKILRPFVYLMQDEIMKCRTGIRLGRPSRRNKLPFVMIGK